MKNKIIYVGLLAISASFTSSSQQKIELKGRLTENAKPVHKLYLAKLLDPKTKTVKLLDSATVKKNKFEFKLKNIIPGKYEVRDEKGTMFSVYLDRCKTEIVIDSFFMKPAISGNPADALIKKYEGLMTGFALMQMGTAFMNQKYMKEGKQMPDSILNGLTAQFKQIDKTKKELIDDMIARKDLTTAYILAAGNGNDFESAELKQIYNDLAPYVQQSEFGINFKTLLDKITSVAIGVKAPNFTQKDTEGNDVQLAAFIKNKKLVLIDFWASWCGPCRKENPNVVAIYKEYKNKGFDIIGVSLDSKKDDWLKAIKDDGLTWMHVSDLGGWQNGVAKQYNVTAVPHTILVDGDGKIIAKNLRGEELKKKVEEVCK